MIYKVTEESKSRVSISKINTWGGTKKKVEHALKTILTFWLLVFERAGNIHVWKGCKKKRKKKKTKDAEEWAS